MRMGTREYYEERILHVQIYIQEHLDEDISLEDLAEVACFSYGLSCQLQNVSLLSFPPHIPWNGGGVCKGICQAPAS